MVNAIWGYGVYTCNILKKRAHVVSDGILVLLIELIENKVLLKVVGYQKFANEILRALIFVDREVF